MKKPRKTYSCDSCGKLRHWLQHFTSDAAGDVSVCFFCLKENERARSRFLYPKPKRNSKQKEPANGTS